MPTSTSYATMKPLIESRWTECSIRPDGVAGAESSANKIIKNQATYKKVEAATGVPWWWVGCIHGMESNFDFSTWLANGDDIGAPTVHEPAGLECDGTWLDGAIVSLKHEGYDKEKDWSLAHSLYLAEMYNGAGYANRGLPSQYVWSFTTIEKAGRYVADGVWDANAWSGQIGVAAMLLRLIARGTVTLQGETPVPTAPSAPSTPVEERVTWLDLFRRSDRGEVGIAAMREGTCLATWQGFDRTSLIDFLGRFPNAGEVLAAPVNKPWPGIGATPTAPVEKFLRLTRVGEKDEFGCEKLLLELVGTGEKWTVVSGQPSVQTFQKGAPTNIPGSGFPLPQGEYDVGEIEFAGETDDYSGTFGAGLGPVWIAIEPKFTTQRSAFGIHLDANRWAGAPGTMGCVGVPLLDDVKRLVKALRANPVTVLRVAWGV